MKTSKFKTIALYSINNWARHPFYTGRVKIVEGVIPRKNADSIIAKFKRKPICFKEQKLKWNYIISMGNASRINLFSKYVGLSEAISWKNKKHIHPIYLAIGIMLSSVMENSLFLPSNPEDITVFFQLHADNYGPNQTRPRTPVHRDFTPGQEGRRKTLPVISVISMLQGSEFIHPLSLTIFKARQLTMEGKSDVVDESVQEAVVPYPTQDNNGIGIVMLDNLACLHQGGVAKNVSDSNQQAWCLVANLYSDSSKFLSFVPE